MNVGTFSSYSPVAGCRYRVVYTIDVVSTGNVLHTGGSAGIKKGWIIIVIARPFKANIQVRVLQRILDLRHVVLTLGAIWLFKVSTKITFGRGLVGIVCIEVVTSPKITITHVLQRPRTFTSIPKFQILR